MIARILVPRDVRPLTEEEAKKQKPAARFETYMDDRMVVPSGLSDAPPLNGKSSIPSHLPARGSRRAFARSAVTSSPSLST